MWKVAAFILLTGTWAHAACTELLAFSQTLMWANTPGFEAHIPGDEWQTRFRSGGDINIWANPAADVWSAPTRTSCLGGGSPVLCTPCSNNVVHRVVLTITLGRYESNVAYWEDRIRAAIATIRAKYPALEQIVLQPIVGGPNGNQCPFPGQTRGVRAAYNFPFIVEAIGRVVGGDVIRGATPTVAQCQDYVDQVGHLASGAREPLGDSIGLFYATDNPCN